jgi:dienelactone hydrolase
MTINMQTLLLIAALAGCDPGPPKVVFENSTTVPEHIENGAIVRGFAVEPITLTAADGVIVHGLYYRAERPKALILLFHQAGSSKDEYATIAPKLVKAGYSALAIDQRAGDRMFGPNLTADGLGKSTGYLEAMPDLQAALDWAEQRKLPVVLWGSSYSSSLIFGLAAANPGEVKALLAFSPGEYFDDKMWVRRAAAKVTVPVFVTQASDTKEIAEAKAVLEAVASTDKRQFEPQAGVHGSSTLIPARNPQGAEENWGNVLMFLREHVG